MRKLDVEVYQTLRELVIVGLPDTEDTDHNCDAMGCLGEHVLFRFLLPEQVLVGPLFSIKLEQAKVLLQRAYYQIYHLNYRGRKIEECDRERWLADVERLHVIDVESLQ